MVTYDHTALWLLLAVCAAAGMVYEVWLARGRVPGRRRFSRLGQYGDAVMTGVGLGLGVALLIAVLAAILVRLHVT